MFDDDEMLTVEDVAGWLQVSEKHVFKLMKSDHPLPVRRFGFSTRVRVGDLREWIRATPIVGV